MYNFLRKNNKKLLAIFAVGLMIVFVLPSTFQPGQGGDRVLAHVGDDPLRASQILQAEREWKLLSDLRAGPRSRFMGPLPFTFRLGWNEMSELELMQGRPPVPVRAIESDPRLFLLLQEEARRMGVTVNNDQLQEVLANELPPAQNREMQELLTSAVRSFMLVQNAFERGASVIKVSEPVRRHALAQQMQTINLRVVEYGNVEFTGKTPPPTTQQVEEHFKRFADTPKGTTDEKTNPFGFGYRFPNRVKFQYVAIPRAEVRKAVEASREPYQWEVESQKYYQQNLKQFPVTQPTTAPADAFTLGSTRPATAATTGPTTRPFAEVREDVKNRIITPEVDRRVAEIQSRITSMMNGDYQAFRKATSGGATTAPAAPTSSLGVPYDSFDYLKKLAEVIQRDFKVLPTVTTLQDEFRGDTELRVVPNVGQARVGENGPRLPEYLTSRAEVFVPADQRDEPDVLSRLEPSQPLRDELDNVYIVRITDAEPAHAPKDVSVVAEAVKNDVVAAQSFAQAKEAATQLLAAARQSGLASAAQASGRNVISVGPVSNRASADIPNFPLTSPSSEQFIRESFKLLSRAATQPAGKQPLALIELPQAGKVVVAELADVKPAYDAATASLEQGRVRQQVGSELRQMFEIEWFNPENIRARLAYRAEDESARPEPANNVPAQPRPPMF